VLEIDYDTSGQAETVNLALNLFGNPDEEVFIFNIDTILTNFKKYQTNADGYLETFYAEGDHWSFARVKYPNTVLETAEKIKISDHCSNCLYYFKIKGVYQTYYNLYSNQSIGETYIAPMYNFLIAENRLVLNKSVATDSVILCGTPLEYERLIC
jgi:hypothetical protein